MTRTLPTVLELEARIDALTTLIRDFETPDNPDCQRLEDERRDAIRQLMTLVDQS